jgi:hypothetical protein
MLGFTHTLHESHFILLGIADVFSNVHKILQRISGGSIFLDNIV